MIEPQPHTDSELSAVFKARKSAVRPHASAKPAKRSRGLLRLSQLATVLVLAAAVAWFFTLRPEALGGPASYVMVSGVSMEPTYKTGDMVVMRKRSHYLPGEIIAYHVPAGEVGAGALVIHRVTGSDAEGYVTKGDNRKGEDLWRPQQSDVIGKAWLHLPGLGRVFSQLRAPLPIAAIAGLFTVYFVLTFSRPKRNDEAEAS